MTLSQTSTVQSGANIPKPDIYQSLSTINQSLQVAIEHLEKLKVAEVLTASFAVIRRLAVEQIRSEINVTATIRLHTSEFKDAHAFEQQRLREEKRLRESTESSSETEVLAG